MRARGAVTILTLTLLLVGCGGSHPSSSSSPRTTATGPASTSTTSTAAPSGHQAAGRDGGFTTVLPSGFHDATAQANNGTVNVQFAAATAPESGFATNINVIRSQVQPGADLSRLTDHEVATLRKQLPGSHSFSPVRRSTVGGQPARELDYFAPLRGRTLHIHQVFSVNKGFAYTITYTALPATYGAHLHALSQVLAAWRWS